MPLSSCSMTPISTAPSKGGLLSKFRNAGQTCVCTNRIIVQSGIHDAFIDRFASKVSRLRVGSGTEPGVEQGPLIDEHAVRKVEELLQDATTKGATGATGGHRYSMGGLFFESTVVRDASVEMRVMKEEIFGPVAPVFRSRKKKQSRLPMIRNLGWQDISTLKTWPGPIVSPNVWNTAWWGSRPGRRDTALRNAG